MSKSCTPSSREACWDLSADPGTPGRARGLVRETLTAWGMGELVLDVTLVVSELLANSMIHGVPPIVLALKAFPGTVIGTVADRGPAWPSLRPARGDEENGRGLMIVSALADRWGVDPLPDGPGKIVWFACGDGRRP